MKKQTFALFFGNRGFMPAELIKGARTDMVKAVTDAGYDYNYFTGLLSEVEETRTERGRTRTIWKKLPGHERNEPLDIRNYAYAALNALDPDMDAVERRLKGAADGEKQSAQQSAAQNKRRRSVQSRAASGDDW